MYTFTPAIIMREFPNIIFPEQTSKFHHLEILHVTFMEGFQHSLRH